MSLLKTLWRNIFFFFFGRMQQEALLFGFIYFYIPKKENDRGMDWGLDASSVPTPSALHFYLSLSLCSAFVHFFLFFFPFPLLMLSTCVKKKKATSPWDDEWQFHRLIFDNFFSFWSYWRVERVGMRAPAWPVFFFFLFVCFTLDTWKRGKWCRVEAKDNKRYRADSVSASRSIEMRLFTL